MAASAVPPVHGRSRAFKGGEAGLETGTGPSVATDVRPDHGDRHEGAFPLCVYTQAVLACPH